MIIEEEPEGWQEEQKKTFPEDDIPLNGKWKVLVTTVFAMMTLCTVMASAFYFRESGKNSQEEKKVAAGVADVAMSLIYTKLKGITPNKQNWSDPEFLNSNIVKVVSPDLHPQAVIDHQGQFNDYPYLLRVYTNGDMSHFLVIAQPGPNLHQWFVHKKAVVIDSKSMEIRKISDLKTLNRLLANPNPLAGANGEEISRLVKGGKLMSLSSLAGRKNRWGFTPPNELSKIKPGAENRVYNAPRYYPMGEAIIDRAVQASAQFDLEHISQFSDLVLFSSQGIERAVTGLNSIKKADPDSDFMIAYIIFNDDGIVINSHIIDQEIANGNFRKKTLQQITEKMIALLKENNNKRIADFEFKMADLLKEYNSLDIADEVDGLYKNDKINGMDNIDPIKPVENLDNVDAPENIDSKIKTDNIDLPQQDQD